MQLLHMVVAAVHGLHMSLERACNHLANGGNQVGRHTFCLTACSCNPSTPSAAHRPRMSDAGRKLIDQSHQQKAVVNDADRLRKFLHKFGLNREQLKQSY